MEGPWLQGGQLVAGSGPVPRSWPRADSIPAEAPMAVSTQVQELSV